MNVLFTCAGRRNYLIKYFKDALNGQGNVLAADSDKYAPALQDADIAVSLPSIYDDSYVSSLLAICSDEKVDMVISLNDLELPILTAERCKFTDAGLTLLVSKDEVIEYCSDKVKTASFLTKHGIDTPKTYSLLDDVNHALKNGEISFPLMVKPRRGSASIGLMKVYNETELGFAFELTSQTVNAGILARISAERRVESTGSKEAETDSSVIVQELIDGDEYGLDILNDLSGNHVCVYAKRKNGMRAGETDRAELVDCEELQELGAKLGRLVGHIGNLDVDVFKTNNRIVVLEMNPRFGGGYPFSHELGSRYPEALLAWLGGEEFNLSMQSRKYNTVVSKCDRLLSVEMG